MEGNKNPGSSYKNSGPGEELKNKGLMGPVDQSDWWDGDSSKSTMLPEVEIGSDGSSKINFDSSTDKGIKTLYTGDRVGEGTGSLHRAPQKSLQGTGSLEKAPQKSLKEGILKRSKSIDAGKKSLSSMVRHEGLHDVISTAGEPLNYSHGEINQMRQKKMDAGNLSNIAKESSKFLTDPVYTLTKRSGKEKVISKKRHDKLDAKLWYKKNIKGKKPKRSVSDASIVERIMSKGK